MTAYLHGFTESVGEVQLPVFKALDCEEKTDGEFINFLMSSPTVLSSSRTNPLMIRLLTHHSGIVL